MFEYFLWNAPILLFLELSSEAELPRDIVTFALKHDSIFAAAATGACDSLDKEFRLHIVRSVLHSPMCEGATVPKDAVVQDLDSYQKVQVPGSALGGLSAKELLALACNPSEEDGMKVVCGLSAAENVTAADFQYLKDLFLDSLDPPDVAALESALAIARISTRESFEFVAQVHKMSRTKKDSDPLWEDIPLVACCELKYSPSLQELLAAFPFPDANDVLGTLLHNVSDLTTDDQPAIEQLLASNEWLLISAVSDLLVRAKPPWASRLLIEAHNAERPNPPLIRAALSSAILRLDPSKAKERLDANTTTDVAEYFGSSFVNPLYHDDWHIPCLNVLINSQSNSAVDYLIRYAHQDAWNELTRFCIDELKRWPGRPYVLSKISDDLKTKWAAWKDAPPIENCSMLRLELLSTYLGETECTERFRAIFNELFSRAILRKKVPLPSDKLLRQLRRKDSKSWNDYHYRESLKALPWAIRAAGTAGDQKIGRQLLHILQSETVEFELIVESLTSICFLARKEECSGLIQELLASEKLMTFMKVAVEARDDLLSLNQSRMWKAFEQIYNSVPNTLRSHMLTQITQLYFALLRPKAKGTNVNIRPLNEMIVSLVRQSTDQDAVAFLLLLKESLVALDEKAQRHIRILMEMIKVAKGRRFLDMI
jgi:hypothetical protein